MVCDRWAPVARGEAFSTSKAEVIVMVFVSWAPVAAEVTCPVW